MLRTPSSYTNLRIIWLVALIGVLGWFKLRYSSATQNIGTDGGFYANVAMNVRDGAGLKTNVSLYHKGFTYFPHPTAVYPLWPLALGYASRVVPLHQATVWLPTCFYFLSLLGAYVWASGFWRGPLLRSWLPGLDAGHILVLMLGLNKEYFIYTSRPYTEALAFTLLFFALFRFQRLFARLGWKTGLEMGAWLGVMTLCRSQLMICAFALFGSLVWAALPRAGRRESLTTLAVSVAVFVATMVPYCLHLASFVDGFHLGHLVRFDQARANGLLSNISTLVETNGLTGWLLDRAKGLVVAFGAEGYPKIYYLYPAFLVLAVPVGVVALLQHWRAVTPTTVRGWLTSKENRYAIFIGILTVGGFLTIHAIHKDRALFTEWNFARRHALTCVFLFLASAVFLFRVHAVGRVLALLVLVAGTAQGLESTAKQTSAEEKKHPPKRYRAKLAKWLLRERDRAGGQLTVAMSRTYSQRISSHTPGVNYHWVAACTSFDDLQTMCEKLGARYLVTEPWRVRRYPFGRPRSRFDDYFEPVAEKMSGFSIYACKGVDAGASSAKSP